MNASLPTPQADHPDCFQDASQYQHPIKSRAGDGDNCTDCARAYQHQMIQPCRCTHVQPRFFVDCDGCTEGRRPVTERLVHCKKKGRR